MPTARQEFDLSDNDVQRLAGDLLNGYIISILCYGLYAMVFGATMREIAAHSEWPKQRVILAMIIIVIWVLTTACAALTWVDFYLNFVSHGQSQDSALDFFLEPKEAQLLLLAMQRSLIALNGVFADLVNIWRCWVLYNRNWGVIVLPLFGMVAGLISHALRTAVLFSHEPGTSIYRDTLDWLTVYCSVAASTNISTTSLIIYRILSISGFRGARTYRGVIEVIVESALLYSVTYVIYLALCIHDYHVPYLSLASWYAEAFLNAITAAAPTLIIWRFAAGEARLNDSWLHTLPHIHTTTVEETRVTSLNPVRTRPAYDDDSGRAPLREREDEGFMQSEDTLVTVSSSSYNVDMEKGPPAT